MHVGFHTWHGSRKTGRRPIFRTRIAPRHLKLSELGLKFLRAPDCVQPTHHFAACGGRRNTARRARQSSVPFFVTQRPVFHVPHFGTFHMAARGLAELAHGSYTFCDITKQAFIRLTNTQNSRSTHHLWSAGTTRVAGRTAYGTVRALPQLKTAQLQLP